MVIGWSGIRRGLQVVVRSASGEASERDPSYRWGVGVVSDPKVEEPPDAIVRVTRTRILCSIGSRMEGKDG